MRGSVDVMGSVEYQLRGREKVRVLRGEGQFSHAFGLVLHVAAALVELPDRQVAGDGLELVPEGIDGHRSPQVEEGLGRYSAGATSGGVRRTGRGWWKLRFF